LVAQSAALQNLKVSSDAIALTVYGVLPPPVTQKASM
jgi:hypothetical protein